MYGSNPFRPTFGVSPPVLAGRYEILEDFATALDEGPGALERASLFVGARGTGKTVMLNEVEAIARQRGWHVVAETATPGLVERLESHRLPELLTELDPDATTWRLKGVSGMGVGASWDTTERHRSRPDLRAQLRLLGDVIPKAGGAGLLLTVDEIHGADRSEIRDVGATIQHCFREELPIAFVAAGLPSAVHDMLASDKVLTFLRRGARYELGEVDLAEAAQAIETPLNDHGRTITPDALDLAARATSGYPFMIQMIGAQLWRHAGDADTVTVDTAQRAIRTAMPRMGRLVHEPALADLSDGDRAFLAAMAVDDGPSRISDIKTRLDVSDNYAGQYRLRLLGAEIIEDAGRGRVDFELPYLREYLRTDGFRRPLPTPPASRALDAGAADPQGSEPDLDDGLDL